MGTTQEDIPDEDGDASEVERAYLRDAEGDPSLALREAIRDGLAERRRARLREALQARAISHGYVRGKRFDPTL
ncbi:hypothetical protein FV242_05865 [Methylobacterium sp. WL64]|uniref:hypothetical protein n=1 Tax=Methylobacterium sp. WL64 TaxID=2603894 RepID=UPI0011CA13DA|nr:hypothetical protein [Methylobacterium sp. WL64]TXN04877.1 hypothetical protein FV242_05865 [Methylobacterium sp. WL64]